MDDAREQDVDEVMEFHENTKTRKHENNETIEQLDNDLERKADNDGSVEVGRDKEKQQINLKKAMGLAGILVFGVGIIVFGGFRISKMIASSFEGYGHEEIKKLRNKEIKGTDDDLDLALKGRDTDKDGLSDYDEIYIYGTSAYIGDTDSDGRSDFEELKEGGDPLCPKGVNCYSDVGDEGQNANLQMDANAANMQIDDVDVGELRQALLEAGVDEEMINQIDDATLLEMYKETVGETGVDPLQNPKSEILNPKQISPYGGSPAGRQNSNDPFDSVQGGQNSNVVDELGDLTAGEIRALLIEAGAEEGAVNAVDDETLRQIYLETLSEF